MLIQYYNGTIPYEELRERLGSYKDGISAYQMIEVARQCGFESIGIEGSFESFQNENILLPCVAHILLNESYYHYIVLFEMNVKKHYFIVGDPAKGIYKMSFTEFEQVWNQVLITFQPIMPIIHIEPNQFLKKSLSALLCKEKKVGIYLLLTSIMITIVSIFHSTLINHFVSMLETHDETWYLYLSVILYLFFITIKNGSSFLRNKVFFHVYERIDFHFMNTIFRKILNLPYRYYKNHTTGEMVARIGDIGVIRTFLTNFVLSSIMDFPLFLASGIGLFFIQSKLFIGGFLIVMLYCFIFFIYQHILKKKIEQLEECNAKVTSYMVEAMNGYESLFGSHLKSRIEKRFSNYYRQYVKEAKQLEMYQNQEQMWSESLFDFSILFIFALGIYFVANEQMTMSALLLFHSLFLYFINPLKNMVRLGGEFHKVKIAWKRLSNIFYKKEETGIYLRKISGEIRFQNVYFEYFLNQPILKKLNFEIHAGEKVLITGESGNGKSTILKLLMKYYKVNRNSIFVDEIDINDYKEEAIEQNILYVSMKEQLFTGSIGENISFDKHYDEAYWEVLKITETDSIIEHTQLGHHLILEENGANISGGERQRIILARSLLLPFQVLLLDEATSQIDVDMERRILKRIFGKHSDKTILLVSHRTDNMDLFDRWISIKDGTIKKDVKKNDR